MIDYHIHSHISADGKTPMKDMARAAAQRGIHELCFTEHIDIGVTEGPEFTVDFERYRAEIDGVKAEFPQMNIRMGVEAGLDIDTKQRMAALLPNLDYVIGSQHLVFGLDPYYKKLWERYAQREVFEGYLAETLQTVGACEYFDVLGHLGYVSKFCPHEDKLMRYSDYTDAIDAILKLLVEKGKGLEVNTCGLVMTPDVMPETPILRRYFELGGEIVTVGSDAHDEAAVGRSVNDALKLLKEIGFKYVCAFDARKPRFISIV